MSKSQINTKPWLIYENGLAIYLDNISYLNKLIERSHSAIKKNLDHNHILFTMYDF